MGLTRAWLPCFALLVAAAALPLVEGATPSVRIHVMSKCPDAHLCQGVISDTVKLFGTKIDLNVDYIERNGACLHGPSECTGNKEQLCVRKFYPQDLTWWRFIECHGRSYLSIPANSRGCADELGIDWDALRACADGDEGERLMRESFERSRTAGAEKSCTVFVNEELHCVVDRRTWSPSTCERDWHSLAWKICEKNATACNLVFWE